MKPNRKIIILIVMYLLSFGVMKSQVLISPSGGTPNESAMLEIQSSDKGLLIPRIKTTDRENILNPAPGLLVFDSDLNSFYMFGKGKWNDLSTSTEIWSQNSSSVYLTNTSQNLGVGTINPSGKFVIKADALKNPGDPLFEIQDVSGNPIFVVTSEGARVYVKEYTAKGASGGFAVGKYSVAKEKANGDLFFINYDSTRVYTNGAKGAAGGFAVGKYGVAKDQKGFYFYTGIDSTRVYTDDAVKGAAGGFAVGKYSVAKGEIQNYTFYTAKDSTRVYTDDAVKGAAGGFAVGKYGVAKSSPDNYMQITHNNAFIGYSAGVNTTGTDNIFIGKNAGIKNTTGSNNIFLGNLTGTNTLAAGSSGNIFIGKEAGSTETGNNKLYIHNGLSDPNTSLVYGDFSSGSEKVFLNGNLRFNRGTNSISMPSVRGNNNEVLTISTDGTTNWKNVNTLITLPPAYEPPTIEITFEQSFRFEVDDNIGTLIVGTAGLEDMTVDLPSIEKNYGRIIKIKNARKSNSVLVYPAGSDVIENLKNPPLIIGRGETYTLQAGLNKLTSQKIWFIIDYTSETLESINNLVKVTGENYDFNTDPDGESVYTLILSGTGQLVTLPASNLNSGRTVIIKNSPEGKTTIKPDGTDKIDGLSSLPLNNGFEAFTLQTDGDGNWYIINHYLP